MIAIASVFGRAGAPSGPEFVVPRHRALTQAALSGALGLVLGAAVALGGVHLVAGQRQQELAANVALSRQYLDALARDSVAQSGVAAEALTGRGSESAGRLALAPTASASEPSLSSVTVSPAPLQTSSAPAVAKPVPSAAQPSPVRASAVAKAPLPPSVPQRPVAPAAKAPAAASMNTAAQPRPSKVAVVPPARAASRPVPPAAAVPPVVLSPTPEVVTVTPQQANVAAIDAAGVRFNGGKTVAIGDVFPSGERLISVAPSEGRIVTDRRVIMLKMPPVAP